MMEQGSKKATCHTRGGWRWGKTG